MQIHLFSSLRKTLAFLALTIPATAQIDGSPTPCGGAITEYNFYNGNTYNSPDWTITTGSGTVTPFVDGNNYHASVVWNSTGAGTLTFKNGHVTISTLNVSVSTPPANPTGSFTYSGTCNTHTSGAVTIITRTDNPPSGVTWYWQDGTETSTTLGSGNSYIGTFENAYALRALSDGCWSTGSLVTGYMPGPVSITNDGYACFNGTVTLSASAPGSPSFRWYASCSGGAILGTGATFVTPALTETTVYYVALVSGGVESPRKHVVANILPPYSGPIPTGQVSGSATTSSFAFGWTGSNVIELDVSSTMQFSTYVENYENASAVDQTGNPVKTTMVNGLASGTTYYYRFRSIYTATITCRSGYTAVQTGTTVTDPPTATAATDIGSSFFTANWTAPFGADSYLLEVSPTIDFNNPEEYVITTPGQLHQLVDGLGIGKKYYYRVRAVNEGGVSAYSNIMLAGDWDHNYVRVVEPQKALNPLTDVDETINSLDVHERMLQHSFFDGLGRPDQVVRQKQSPEFKDLIQSVVYDKYGIESVRYLIYAEGDDSWFKSDFKGKDHAQYANSDKSPLYRFYQNTPEVAHSEHPYAVTVFERSPLGRVVEQGTPGDSWQPDANNAWASQDHTTKYAYELNSSSEVLQWTHTTSSDPQYLFGNLSAGTAASPVYYPANELTKNKTKDEDHHEVYEFKDKQGRVILKQSQVDGSVFASTYFIYDLSGQLVSVIPPQAVALLATEYHHAGSSAASKEAFLKRWAFRYKYDFKRRMTHKQLPGADHVYMVYDKRDRLVLTQDGNQRNTATKYWTFTKYDQHNRPILTGIRDTTAALSQADMQAVVTEHEGDTGATLFETYVGSASGNVHGYSNKSYPVITGVTSEVDQNKYLTVTYYDNYAFTSLWHGTYTYIDDNLSETANSITYNQPDAANNHVTGLVTGSKVKVLDGGVTGGVTWLHSVSYYDDKYRAIQTQSDNYKGGMDITTHVYDFTGKVLKTKTSHSESDVIWKDLVNTAWTGTKVSRTISGNSWGDSGAATVQQLAASTNGWVEFTVGELYTRAVGLTDTNPDADYVNMDYCLRQTTGAINVYENGTFKYLISSAIALDDVLRIERTGNTVVYKRNGTTVYTSATASYSALMVDVSLMTSSARISGIRTSFSGTTNTVTRRFTYDHAGRLLRTYHKLNSGAEVILSENEYNELGQLIDKKLYSTDNGTTYKQSTDLRYNIRGWLTSINNSQLTNDGTLNDDPNGTDDLFGMELGYNSSIGSGNSSLYNGNISAMKWSTNLARGTVKDIAYNYSYDALNRITGATFRKNTSGTWANASNAFNESDYTYDLNGNIKSLKRRDDVGTLIDDLTYDYGTTASNQLMKVTDAGNDTKGFKEVNNSADDYVYDANGNMVWDRNKGGVEVVDNGSFDSGSTGWTLTDAGSRLSWGTSGRMDIAVSATHSASIKQANTIKRQVPYVVIIDFVRTSGSGTLTINVGGTTQVITASATLTLTAGNGVDFSVLANTAFVGYINSISVRGLTVVSYNYLNLPEQVSNAKDHLLTYIYDATGRKLNQTVARGDTVKMSEYNGEFFYETDTMKFINHEEGRIVVKGTPEYQYHLKDHLGNVRMTFTTALEHEIDKATLETSHLTDDAEKFLRVSSAKRVNAAIFDHTNDDAAGYSQRLNGSTDEKFGLARSLSVMPGDTVKAEVYAKYVDENSNNWNGALTTLIGQIAANTTGVVYTGESYSGSTTSFPFPGTQATMDNEEPPKAYLNWLVFDRNYIFNSSKSGYQQISTYAKEAGSDVDHELLNSPAIAITEPGYVYFYLSNEETSPVEVYFDDFKVTHTKSPVVQSDDYYPFGHKFNSYARENSLQNRMKLFQGQEHVDDLGLNWDSFKWRNHMPDIGRFFNIDKLADKYVHNSPYAFSENKVVAHRELEGLEAQHYMGSNPLTYMAEGFRQYFDAALSLFSFEGKAYTNVSGKNAEMKSGSASISTTTSTEIKAFVNVDFSGVMDYNQNNKPAAPEVKAGIKTTVEQTTESKITVRPGGIPVNIAISNTVNGADETVTNKVEASVGLNEGPAQGKVYVSNSTTTPINGTIVTNSIKIGAKIETPIYNDGKQKISVGAQVELTTKN